MCLKYSILIGSLMWCLFPSLQESGRMCVDFIDQNKACPKDPYPLPQIDIMVDSTTGFEMFSMMDAYQGYHQIYMAKEDREKTFFVTDKGIYCYNVMSFGLKNAGATYQQLVNKMFSELIGRTMEVYVDDMVVKSKRSQDHLEQRGIEANPEKIQAIMSLRSPTTIKEVQKLTSKIASLNRFISRSADKSLHFFKTLRKTKNFERGDVISVLGSVRERSQLGASVRRRESEPHLLCEQDTARGRVEVFRNGEADTRTSHHSSQAATIFPIVLNRCIDQSSYETCDVPTRNVRKVNQMGGRIGASCPAITRSIMASGCCTLMDPQMQTIGEAGILIQGAKEVEIEVAARLSFPITNNEAEYESLILGLELAYDAGARDLEVFTNSQLVALQIEGTYETREKTMTSYRDIVKNWMDRFYKCSILQVPRAKNDKADALSTFGATMSGIRDHKVTALVREQSTISGKAEVQTISGVEFWKDKIVKYLENDTLPEDPIKAKRVRFRASRFTLISGQLYKQTLWKSFGSKVASSESDAPRILLANYVKGHKGAGKEVGSCQKYASLIHQLATPIEPVKIACPFDQWRIDIVGPFPPTQSQKKFLIIVVGYFSKWVKAEAVARISEKEVIAFIWKNIICRFDIPRILISDNGTQFQGKKIMEWCKELKIAQHFTAVANPQANG
ncbi:UNVERIFIED_CONTAM: Retrovirus-related Pol polyprotein from transposon opus [Sesamum indicum]